MDKHKAMSIHGDLEILITELEKVDYLLSNLCDAVSPISDEKTAQEKVQKALDFYESRKEMQICSSLLCDVIHTIGTDLTGATNDLWELIHSEQEN